MIAAIIPARGGSKRIPRKNLRPFCGRPMIVWSLEVARRAGLFDRVVVSTDDPEIAAIAREAGAEVPFVRPAELSGDHAATLPVIRHAVLWLEQDGGPVEAACCIYPTAPFLQVETLRGGLEMLRRDPGVDFVFPVTDFEFPIFRSLKLGPHNEVSMFWPEHELTRSQDLPRAYHDAGQCYWGTGEAWKVSERIYSSRTRAVILPRHQVQDIDTEEDWIRAEQMFRLFVHE